MFQFKLSTISLLTIYLLSLSACSSKSPQTAECGEGTVQQGTAIGTVVGAVAGKLAHTNIFVGAIVGGLIGTIVMILKKNVSC